MESLALLEELSKLKTSQAVQIYEKKKKMNIRVLEMNSVAKSAEKVTPTQKSSQPNILKSKQTLPSKKESMSLRAIDRSNTSEDREQDTAFEPETLHLKESVKSKSIKKSKSKSPTRVKNRRGRAWK